MAFISIENLTTHYDTSKGKVHALEDVSFSLEKGQSVGIAGESACGKSTLGLSLIRMIPNGKIISGKIIFDGKSFLEISDSEFDKKHRWKDITMVFQVAMNSLDPVFTIKQQFIEILKEHDFKGNVEKIILVDIPLNLVIAYYYLKRGLTNKSKITIASSYEDAIEMITSKGIEICLIPTCFFPCLKDNISIDILSNLTKS